MFTAKAKSGHTVLVGPGGRVHAFDEAEHPRDEAGKFADKGAADTPPAGRFNWRAIDAAVLGTDGPVRVGLFAVNSWGRGGVESLSADPGVGRDAAKALRRAADMYNDAEFAGVNLSRATPEDRAGPHGPAIAAAESVVARVRSEAPAAIGRAAEAVAAGLPDYQPPAGTPEKAIRVDRAELPAGAERGLLVLAEKGRIEPPPRDDGAAYVDAASPAGNALWAASARGENLSVTRVRLVPRKKG